jgi:hypothetical protein
MSLQDEFLKNRVKQMFEGTLVEISVRPAATRQNASNPTNPTNPNKAVAANMQQSAQAGKKYQQQVQKGVQQQPAQVKQAAQQATQKAAGQPASAEDVIGWIKANNALKKPLLLMLKKAIKTK